jgi:hypothetical protein
MYISPLYHVFDDSQSMHRRIHPAKQSFYYDFASRRETTNYTAMSWDLKTGKPGKKKLLELGLDDVAQVLYYI